MWLGTHEAWDRGNSLARIDSDRGHGGTQAMATPKRPAKSGGSWTFNDLDAYNIRIKAVNTKAFFGTSDLPHPSVDPVILQNVDVSPDLSSLLPIDIGLFFEYLYDTADKSQPSVVDDFTHHLLSCVMRFRAPGGGRTCRRPTFPFIMSGRRVKATADVSVRREDYQIILVQRQSEPCSLSKLRCTAEHYKDISRPSRASASGLCSRRILHG
jgi:hypothetical protein